jgi:hypothetical protein
MVNRARFGIRWLGVGHYRHTRASQEVVPKETEGVVQMTWTRYDDVVEVVHSTRRAIRVKEACRIAPS